MMTSMGQRTPTRRRQPLEAARAVNENALVVVSDVDDDVQAEAAVRRDRLVHRGMERWHDCREGVLPLAWPQSEARTVALRRHVAREDVDAEVQPPSVEGRLDRLDDARLPGSRSATKNDELSGRSVGGHSAP